MKKGTINIFSRKNTKSRKAQRTFGLIRWGTISSLKSDWNGRTEIMSKYIVDNTKVIEFGAGRLVLSNLIPENCVYTPSDIVDRGEGTIVLDLNKSPLPMFDHYDYAVFSGVLEYVNSVPLLIKHLSEYMDSFILSYATVGKYNTKNRKRNGWVNNYSEKEIIQILEQNNFVLTNKTIWRRQTIFVFKKYKVNKT